MVGYYRLSSDLHGRTHIRFGCPTCDLACSFRCAGGMDCGRTVIRGCAVDLTELMRFEAVDIGDEVFDFLPRWRKTAYAAVRFGEEGGEPVVGPADVAGDSRQWRGSVPCPTAVDEMALGAPAAGDILAGNRVTRRPHRLIRNNKGAAKRDHRTDDVMRPPHDCSPF